jgi:AcrR family transcriptional regulator
VAVEADGVRGRPRDPDVDVRIRAATLDLLSEEGFAATTIAAVARRAGVGAPAIYRRWSSRIAMIENAIFPGFDDLDVQPTGDLQQDLRRFVDAFLATLDRPAARVALPALLSVYQSDPESNALAAQRVGGSVREAFRSMLAAEGVTFSPDGPDADDVLDVLIGAVLFHLFVRRFSGRPMDSDYIAELTYRAIAG